VRDYAPAQAIGRRVVALTLIAIVGVLCLPPVYYVIDAALSHRADGVRQMLHDPTLGSTLRTTFELAIGSVVLSMVMGTLLAWGAMGLTGRRRWLGFIPLAPLVMPVLAAISGYVYLFNPVIGYGNQLLRSIMFWSHSQNGPLNVNTVPFIVIVTGVLLTSFVYLFVRTALSQLDQGVYDAAAASGASPSRAFFKVVLPLLRPALVYSALTGLVLALGQYTIPLFFGLQQNIQVLGTQIYNSSSSIPPNYPLAAAFGLPIILAGLIFIALQMILLRDQGRYASSGSKGADRSLKKSGWISQGALIVYGVFAVAGPILSVAIVAFQPYWQGHINVSQFTLANFRAVFDNPQLTGAIKNSILYALTATALVVPLGFFCAKVIYRRTQQKVISTVVEVLVAIPLGIPAAIFGVGFLLAFLQGPLNLYGQGSGLVVVYTVITLPFITRVILIGMLNLGSNLVDAGATCGAPLWRRTLSLELPMLRSAIASAAAICLVLSSYEFSASLLIRSTHTQVMGTVLYDQFVNGSNPNVAVMALLMCAITTIGVLLALALGRSPSTKDG